MYVDLVKLRPAVFMVAILFVFVGCDDDCGTLRTKLDVAIAAFSSATSNICSADSDCTLVSTAVSRNGMYCLQGCRVALNDAYGAEYRNFLENDTEVTSACEAVIAANCEDKIPIMCPCHMLPNGTVCAAPGCEGGMCE